MKIKLKNKFTEMKEKKGTKQSKESLTDQSQAEETDIYACLKKYGISTLINKTMATDFMYIDNTNANMTLDEAVRIRNEMEEYFRQQPARVRKVFGDNVDMFIEKYKKGDFNDFLTTGVMSQEMINNLKGENENEKLEENTPSIEGIPANIDKGNIGTISGNNDSL